MGNAILAATAEAVKEFSAYLIGKDPSRIDDIGQNLYRSLYFRGSVIMSAISAIDIAMWDIKGKALGAPVYELLGGKTRDKVRVYASPMSKETDPESLKKGYRDLKAQGFTAAKIFVNGPAKSESGGRDEFFCVRVEDELEKVAMVREAVGKDFDLILEAHRGMTVPEAIAFGREVEKYRPMVLEDPITPDNIDYMAEVASKIAVPIATGERFTNIKEFEMLFRRNVASYVRPDVCAVGGITASKKICAIAEANDALAIPHNPLGPVSTAACLQICASVPNLGIQELPGFCRDGAEDAMVKKPFQVEDGCLLVLDAPGIGVELVENVSELYPPNDRGGIVAKRMFGGSVKDW